MGINSIKGQDSALDILKRSIAQARIAHAYLFLGPPGTGKKRGALEFAKLLDCMEPKNDSCGLCSSCVNIEKGTHPDVSVISKDEGSSCISIDSIRQMQSRLAFKPFEAEYKIAIIADAEDMTEEASNCLLKVLEEPTPDTLLVLTASNQKMLPATIVSRCQVIRFKPLTASEVKEILIKEFGIDEKEARFLSAISGSSVEKALGLKEKEALSWKNTIIDEFSKPGLSQGTSLESKGQRQMQLEAMDILLGFYRDILVYKFSKEKDLIINIDRIDEIAQASDRLSPEAIREAMEDIQKIRSSIRSNANMKLAASVLKERLAACVL